MNNLDKYTKLLACDITNIDDALAYSLGSTMGLKAAEGFQLIRSVQ